GSDLNRILNPPGCLATCKGDSVTTLKRIRSVLLLTISLLLTPIPSSSIAKAQKSKGRPPRTHTAALSRAEMKQAEARLSEVGYVTGRVDGAIDGVTRNALIAFQKWEGRKVTGQLSREDFDAIMSANAP